MSAAIIDNALLSSVGLSVSFSGIEVHDDVIKWKHFPRYWPFVRRIHRSRWIHHTKASDAEHWCFLWYASEWTIEAGDLRRYRIHYDVTVIIFDEVEVGNQMIDMFLTWEHFMHWIDAPALREHKLDFSLVH